MSSLYELTKEQLRLYDLLSSGDAVDEETGEIDPEVAALLESNAKDLDEKIVSNGLVYKQLLADVAALKEEEERLEARRKRREKNACLIKERLQNTMNLLGKDKFYDSKIEVSFRASELVEIDDEKILPQEYFNKKVTYTPVKSSIKAAIKSGLEVPGARLVKSRNIQIK